MKSKRSFLKLCAASIGTLVLVSNCVIKSSTDDGVSCSAGATVACSCEGSSVSGTKTCNSLGNAFSLCVCVSGAGGATGTGGASSTSGAPGTSGTTATGGTGTSGSTGTGGVAGEAGTSGGDAGAAGSPFDNCDECVSLNCDAEFSACQGTCLDQYGAIAACMEDKRTAADVKRAGLRDCGDEVLGQQAGTAWPPPGMDPATTDLVNCMASGASPANNSWADTTNIDANGVSTPWPADSCAKLACTSMK
jgi:hypothetical protein